MNIGFLVSFLIIAVALTLGFLAWRGRDSGPLGRAEREAKLAKFVQSGTEQDLEWRLMQLKLSTRDLPLGKPSIIENWTADCRACLLLEIKLGIEPGKSLADGLYAEERELEFDRQNSQSLVREAIKGLQQGRDILELLQWEIKSKN